LEGGAEAGQRAGGVGVSEASEILLDPLGLLRYEPGVKRWVWLTVALYGLALGVFTLPVLLLSATDLVMPGAGGWSVEEVFRVYRAWGYWLWLGLLLLCQALLLLVPMDVARQRLPSRRRVMVPVLVAAFLMAQLVFAGFFSLLGLGFGDEGYKFIEFLMRLTFGHASANPLTGPTFQQSGLSGDELQAWAVVGGMVLALWVAWSLVFAVFAQRTNAEGLTPRLVRWLLRGSILEFLVAVPSHIVVRHRNDCCAPVATFWGIVTGLSVMLLAFGPSVFFLFAHRVRRLRPGGES
jgi:hypothetical protein